MAVAEASLKNLIPQPRNWPEFTTTPIRVPTELKDWVLDMIAQKVDEIRFSIGNMAPDEQTEQEWINEVCGLPPEYQTGDPLPEAIAAEIAQARSQNEAAAAAEIDPEPPEYTQAWIDYQEAEPNPHGWTWRAYLAALREEAGNGDPGAKADLDRFKSNGVDIGAPLSDQQLAKLARRAKRESGNAAVIFGDAAKVVVLSVGSGQKRGDSKTECDRQNHKGRQKLIKKALEIRAKRQQREREKLAAVMVPYASVVPVYHQVVKDERANLDRLFEDLEQRGLKGKIKRYRAALSIPNFDLEEHLELFPTPDQYLDKSYKADRRIFTDAVCDEYQRLFYSTDKQQEEGNTDGAFYLIICELIRAFEWAICLIELEDVDLDNY